MYMESLSINTVELDDIVNALDKLVADIEKCSSDFFKEITNISTSKEFQGYTADNLKMFSNKFTNTTGKEVSEVTTEVKKCIADGYVVQTLAHEKLVSNHMKNY